MGSKETNTNRMRTFSGSNMLRYRTYLMPPSNPFREGKSKVQLLKQAAMILVILALVVIVLSQLVQHDREVLFTNAVVVQNFSPKEIDTQLLRGEKTTEQSTKIIVKAPMTQHDEDIKLADNSHIDSAIQENGKSAENLNDAKRKDERQDEEHKDPIESSKTSNVDEYDAQHEHNTVAVPG